MSDTAWTVNQGGASGSTENGVASPGHTGTEGSNLSPSSSESAANLTFSIKGAPPVAGHDRRFVLQAHDCCSQDRSLLDCKAFAALLTPTAHSLVAEIRIG